MTMLTGAQQDGRCTGKKYRVLFARESWGKTYLLAYDALWYSRFRNKRILAITHNVEEFNAALSEFPLQEHNSSEIVVSTKFEPGPWFMIIIDNAETYNEADLKSLITQCDGDALLWISSKILPSTHWLKRYSEIKKKNRIKYNEWWIFQGDSRDSYTRNQSQTEYSQEFL